MGEAKTTPEQIKDLKRKTHFSGKIIKTSLAGAIVDIGMEKPGMVHISRLQKEPTHRVEDAVSVGDEVDVWVRQVNKKTGHVELTMIEPVALEWGEIKSGTSVKGEVVRLEKFGAFIEIGAERPGLAHISELTHDYIKDVSDAVKVGDKVDAHILEVDRKKRQIKLSLKALQQDPTKIDLMEDEDEEEEVVPTAMELAIRKAMDSSGEEKTAKQDDIETQDPKSGMDEREAILARTLENKVRTE